MVSTISVPPRPAHAGKQWRELGRGQNNLVFTKSIIAEQVLVLASGLQNSSVNGYEFRMI